MPDLPDDLPIPRLFTEQRACRLALRTRNPHKTEDLVYERSVIEMTIAFEQFGAGARRSVTG